MEIWNIIVQSNTLNFIIMVVLFVVILKWVKAGSLITSMQEKVKRYIDDSTAAKENSQNELKQAEEYAGKVDSEIKELKENADLSAERLGKKILNEADVLTESILKNADKVNEANGKRIISRLSQDAAVASVELAKKHIINVLAKKPFYHAKFVEDSIKELDGFNLNE